MVGLAAKQAHSLVKGPNFIALHGLFDEIYVNADAHAAELVDRLRTLHRRFRSTATKSSRMHDAGAARACADMLRDVDKFRQCWRASCARITSLGPSW
jgi:DNA-binding ferritin-like protein